jgi:hypothetical protein
VYDKNGTSREAVPRRDVPCLMKIRTSREAVPRRDARCTIKMGRLARRYRGGTKAGRAMSDKNGTFEKHITRRYRGGTEAGRALYDKNGTI